MYESVLSWVNHNLVERKQHLPNLMGHVRLPLLSKEYLIQRVDGHGIFESSATCKDYIIEALKYHLTHGDPTKLAQVPASVRIRPRQPIGPPKVRQIL